MMREVYVGRACCATLLFALLHVDAGAQTQATETVPPTVGVQLRLTDTLHAIGPVLAEHLREKPEQEARPMHFDGLTRSLNVPSISPCGTNNALLTTDVLRMADVVNQIICNRVGVREGFGLTEQARAALELAQGQRQPSLSLSAGLDAERGGSTSGTLALRLEWLLFDFGASNAAVQQSRFALAAVLDDQRAEVLLALADAAQLFAAAKTAFSRLDSAAINLRTAQDSARMTEARQEAGAGSLAEKVQAQTALAQTRLEHVRAHSQWLSASGALSIAMGLHASQALSFDTAEVDDDSFFDQILDVKSLIDEARARHPRVSAARTRLAEAQARAKSVDAERWGSINLNAVAGRIRTSGYTELRDTGSASVLWTLPLLDRGVTSARQRDVLGQIQVRNASMDDTLNQIELQVWQQSQALISDRDILREARAVRNSAELSLRVSSERYRSGVGFFSDVLAAQNVAGNARFQWVESRANLLKSQLRLAASVGRFGPLAPTDVK
jgi:outer membrane protein